MKERLREEGERKRESGDRQRKREIKRERQRERERERNIERDREMRDDIIIFALITNVNKHSFIARLFELSIETRCGRQSYRQLNRETWC